MDSAPDLLAKAVDAALEASVVGSFTRLGCQIRSRLFDWPDEQAPMTHKTVVVTGATSGLGKAAATEFARLGAELWLPARNIEKAERVRREITSSTGNDSIEVLHADLAELASVRALADALRRRVERLDVLVNNAGALHAERQVTADGIEMTFQTHVVAPFLLTAELLGPLRTAQGRIITVTSGGMYSQPLVADDLQSERSYRGATAYARAKRAQVLLAEEWARRLGDAGVGVHTMHPGWVDTPGVESALPRFHRILGPLLRSPEQGADTIVWLASTDEPLGTGKLWHDRRRRLTHHLPWTARGDADRHELWRSVLGLSGFDGELPG